MPSIYLHRNPILRGKILKLPASKSISNRALILNALSGGLSSISNLATARDTRLMKALLADEAKTIDARDAGTTMRFLTAYFAVTGQHKIMTGTPRMQERPIGLLVDALRRLGTRIDYLEKEGFPPIEIKGFQEQQVGQVTLPGNVSSQYISALMMVAPALPDGLAIQLEGKVGSWPYIEMTAALMAMFGARFFMKNDRIVVMPSAYHPASVKVEPDWSAISYWLAFVALAEQAEVVLGEVDPNSIQGDKVIVEIMEKLGVKTVFSHGDTLLSKTDEVVNELNWDFSDCPDLAQTVIPVCALKQVHGIFTGLESLYIKETDRVAALQNELAKVGAKLEQRHNGVFALTPGRSTTDSIHIKTYHDHRMAMGFAPWATLMDIEIEDADVVNKSYPEFWDDLKNIRH